MRVLYVSPSGILGGAERSLLDLMAAVGALAPGVDRRLVAFADGPLLERARSLGVQADVCALPDGAARIGDSGFVGATPLATAAGLAGRMLRAGTAIPTFALALRRAIRAHRPDLVHSNGIKSHLLTAAVRDGRVPLVWHARDFWSRRPVVARALAVASHRVDLAVAISDAVADDVRRVMPRLAVRTVHNAIDVDHFAPGPGDGARLDALAGLAPCSPGMLRVGLVATFARWKGQDTFIEAVARSTTSANRARFYIVGGAVYRTEASQFSAEELCARAQQAGVGDRVAFVPFQDDPREVYRALDVVVHGSSAPEPFGRTIVEAMACGRPVIVSNAGGAAEIFRDGVDAVGFPPGDAAALARCIDTVIEDTSLRERLGAAGRSTAVARFSRQRLGTAVLEIYRDILSR